MMMIKMSLRILQFKLFYTYLSQSTGIISTTSTSFGQWEKNGMKYQKSAAVVSLERLELTAPTTT
jgi:hypothetical protein